MTKDEQKEQARLLSEGNGWNCYVFAKYTDGADVEKLQARVMEIGDSLNCYAFAEFVEGADAEKLRARARELEESLYNIFIKNTDGATTTKQQKEPEKNTVPTTDYTISLNKNALIDNFLIQAYALENYFKIDILDELNSIANKISEVDND